MTRVSVNAAHQQVRFALAEFLSHYAHERGLETIRKAPRARGGGDTRLLTRPESGLGKSALPVPDLTWLEGRRPIWKFYILPKRPTLRRLCPTLNFDADAIVCADSSDNLGTIEPSLLLDFLAAGSDSVDKREVRSLAKAVSFAPAPVPDFHFEGVVRKNHQFVRDHFSLRIRTGPVQKPA
ncbi:MAG: hypothetical protein JSV16_00470, partial [Candidatus Hydrogenedentota bacterium]